MTRIVVISSGKGGVGKTTCVANIATALAAMKKDVVAVDCNLTTSNLGLHLGIPLYPATIHDVIRKRVGISDAIYHHPGGFRVIPGDIAIRKQVPSSKTLVDAFFKLVGKADYMLIDSGAGLGKETRVAIEASDEMLTVTNPEMTAVTDALKLVKLAEEAGTENTGVILNRVRREKHEMSQKEVEDFLGVPVITVVNEDPTVRAAIAKREPVVMYRPRARASRQFRNVAAFLEGEQREFSSLLHRLFGWI